MSSAGKKNANRKELERECSAAEKAKTQDGTIAFMAAKALDSKKIISSLSETVADLKAELANSQDLVARLQADFETATIDREELARLKALEESWLVKTEREDILVGRIRDLEARVHELEADT